MEKIDVKTLEKLLYDHEEVTLLSKDGEITLTKELDSFTVSDNGVWTTKSKYVLYKGEEQGQSFARFKGLVKAIIPIAADGMTFTLTSIGKDKRFKTLAEAAEEKAFEHISMAELLKRYPEADRFSLTCFCNRRISEEEAEAAYNKIETIMYESAQRMYDAIKEPHEPGDFDPLYKEIAEECRAFRKKREERIKQCDGNSFFCDEFSRGRTKYIAPKEFWHLYHSVDFVETCAYRLEQQKKLRQTHPAGWEAESIPALKGALISTEATFAWHCTISGGLSDVLTFRLNDETKAWLLTHKDDYDFGEKDNYLQDLALYKGDKILFSSCTHEKFHDDRRADN